MQSIDGVTILEIYNHKFQGHPTTASPRIFEHLKNGIIAHF